jgi:Sec-independent protein translocase protein TatA
MGQGVREFKDATKEADKQQPQYRDQPTTPPQQGYQQPAPPVYNPNDPTNQPR